MSVTPVESFVDILRQHSLLDAARVDEIEHTWKGRSAGSEEVARALVEKRWLTPYQADAVLHGRGAELDLKTYVILDHIGRGGMGDVFRARHRHLGRVVAVKTIRAEYLSNPEVIERFQREARAAAQLHHANVVAVYDAGRERDVHFLAMEYVEGIDLGRLVKKDGPLPLHRACEYLRQAALGLQHAFERGLVHRDIKPSNLMLTSDGGGQSLIKILDFGLVRYTEPLAGESSMTSHDHWLGTPDYIAPEQARDSRTSDTRADIFSLGCTLFYLLTGQGAFGGQTRGEKLAARLVEDSRPIRELRPDVPAELEAVLARMLARDPARRYQTPAELARALAGLAMSAQVRPGPPPRLDAGSETLPWGSSDAPPTPHIRRLPGIWRRRAGRRLALALLALGAIGLALLPVSPVRTSILQPPRDIVNSVGMKLIRIAPGRFVMGAPAGEGQGDDEQPQHEVEITRSFLLSECEVTQGVYLEVMGQNPSHFQGAAAIQDQLAGIDLMRLPVENVSWQDAVRFCARLSERPQEAGRKYRLPTEAEWEYACRAGTTTAFSCGQVLGDERAAFHRTLAGAVRTNPVPVGSFPANAWGLCDMHGNVWEWCADHYAPYRPEKQIDPFVAASRFGVVQRGGGWGFRAEECRSAKRGFRQPAYRGQFVGFRVAADG